MIIALGEDSMKNKSIVYCYNLKLTYDKNLDYIKFTGLESNIKNGYCEIIFNVVIKESNELILKKIKEIVDFIICILNSNENYNVNNFEKINDIFRINCCFDLVAIEDFDFGYYKSVIANLNIYDIDMLTKMLEYSSLKNINTLIFTNNKSKSMILLALF